MLKLQSLIYGVSLFAVTISSASAATVTYVYTGNLFDTFIGAPSGPETKIAAKVTFDQAYVNAMVDKTTIVDFEMSTDGVNFNPGSNYVLSLGNFTFTAGDITDWDLIALSANPRLGTNKQQDIAYYQVGPQITKQNYVNNKPGTWVLQSAVVPAPVPEPETFALFAVGLGLMGAVVRRRKSA